MFCWPCVLIHVCNENQPDALFIFSLFRQSASTCFGHIHPSPANRQSAKKHNMYQLSYIYSIPPDDGLIHVEFDWRNKLKINSASSWFLLHDWNNLLTCNYPSVHIYTASLNNHTLLIFKSIRVWLSAWRPATVRSFPNHYNHATYILPN